MEIVLIICFWSGLLIGMGRSIGVCPDLFQSHPCNLPPSRKTQTKMFYTSCSIIPPPNTHPHAHTPTRPHTHTPTHPHAHTLTLGTTLHSIVQGADAGLAITANGSRRKSAWRIPSSARPQRVSHDGSSARYRSHFANNGYACRGFGGSRLSATPQA